jgi:hypothetical protein
MYPDLQWQDAYQNPKAKVRSDSGINWVASLLNSIMRNPNPIVLFQTCEDKVKILRRDMRQIIDLSLHNPESGCEKVYKARAGRHIAHRNDTNTAGLLEPEYSTKILCKNVRSFSTARERWWFVGMSNCNGTQVRWAV